MFFHWLFLSSVPGSGQRATSSVGRGSGGVGCAAETALGEQGLQEQLGGEGQGRERRDRLGAGQLSHSPGPALGPLHPQLSSPEKG